MLLQLLLHPLQRILGAFDSETAGDDGNGRRLGSSNEARSSRANNRRSIRRAIETACKRPRNLSQHGYRTIKVRSQCRGGTEKRGYWIAWFQSVSLCVCHREIRAPDPSFLSERAMALQRDMDGVRTRITPPPSLILLHLNNFHVSLHFQTCLSAMRGSQ